MNAIPASFPEELLAMDPVEIPLSSGRQVSVQAYRVAFAASPERSSLGLDRSYAAKPLVTVEKQAMFPEIACLTLFKKNGWEGVWADRHHHKYFDKMPTQSKGTSLDTYANQLIARIAENNDKSMAGCWDLILWTHRTLLFVAVPGRGPHGIAEGSARWLAACLRTGLSASQFAIIQWEYRTVVARKKRAHA
jgi:hypothetical protein